MDLCPKKLIMKYLCAPYMPTEGLQGKKELASTCRKKKTWKPGQGKGDPEEKGGLRARSAFEPRRVEPMGGACRLRNRHQRLKSGGRGNEIGEKKYFCAILKNNGQ